MICYLNYVSADLCVSDVLLSRGLRREIGPNLLAQTVSLRERKGRRMGDIDIRKINEKKLTQYQIARLTGTIKNLRKVTLSTVDRELSKARRLFNIAVDEGWLLRSPFTKAVSRNLIHDADETPDPIKTRELTDEEALRVIKALDREIATVIAAGAVISYRALQTEPLVISRQDRCGRHSRQSDHEHGQNDEFSCETF
jgi:hypothetical protein